MAIHAPAFFLGIAPICRNPGNERLPVPGKSINRFRESGENRVQAGSFGTAADGMHDATIVAASAFALWASAR
jgi:hypothetical protein